MMRAIPRRYQEGYCAGHKKGMADCEPEIERLRTALVAQTEQHKYPCSPHCAGYLREQAAQTKIERLQAALEMYGLHLSDCPKNDSPEWPRSPDCLCGFDAVIATMRQT
jgi:hypothetical protein